MQGYNFVNASVRTSLRSEWIFSAKPYLIVPYVHRIHLLRSTLDPNDVPARRHPQEVQSPGRLPHRFAHILLLRMLLAYPAGQRGRGPRERAGREGQRLGLCQAPRHVLSRIDLSPLTELGFGGACFARLIFISSARNEVVLQSGSLPIQTLCNQTRRRISERRLACLLIPIPIQMLLEANFFSTSIVQ